MLTSLLILAMNAAMGQSHQSVFGFGGTVETPNAYFHPDRTLYAGLVYRLQEYAILPFKQEAVDEWHYNVGLMFLPFMEVTATVIRPTNIDDVPWGIGDRSYKMRLRILKEQKNRPAIAIGVHDAFAANTYQGALYAVLSKSVISGSELHVHVHACTYTSAVSGDCEYMHVL